MLRAIGDRRWEQLQPLAELPHPILRKAVESYGPNPDDDPVARPIASATDFRLLELRSSQWRAGIWTDPQTGVRWVCAAGLAKGNHRDHDDFYEQIKSLVDSGSAHQLMPTHADLRLLARETVAQRLTQWELSIQGKVGVTLRRATAGPATFMVPHPTKPGTMATVELTVACDEPGYEDYVVDIAMDAALAGSQVAWVLIRRVLTSVAPTAQEWDRYELTFSQLTQVGHREQQVQLLDDADREARLLPHDPGSVSHYGHRPHLAGSAVDGHAVRALCGVFFVVGQDHTTMPVCPDCADHYSRLPADR